MSVEEYRQKIKLYIMRDAIRKEKNTTIAKLMSELNLEIRDIVELLL